MQSMAPDELRELVRLLVKEHKITQKFIAKEAGGYSGSALTQWLGGNYGRGTDVTFENALRSALERILEKRFFAGNEVNRKFARQRTSVADAVFDAAKSCQQRGLIGLLTGPGGRGKTTAAEMYAASHSDVMYVATSPVMTRSALIRRIASQLNIDRVSMYDMMGEICEKLRNRKALVMIDEAENIPIDYLDALRMLNDQAGIGLLFIGQEAFYTMLARSRKSHEYLVDRFRLRMRVADLGIADVEALTRSVLDVNGLAPTLLKACHGSARFLETLVFHLRDLVAAGEALTERDVVETAEAIKIF